MEDKVSLKEDKVSLQVHLLTVLCMVREIDKLEPQGRENSLIAQKRGLWCVHWSIRRSVTLCDIRFLLNILDHIFQGSF